MFTLDQARAQLAGLRPLLDELIAQRAETAEIAAAVQGGPPTSLGGLPEQKAGEARLHELMTQVQERGIELKGLAPLLLDWPSTLGGVEVLLCWLEGDAELGWYHRTDLGFLGRRRLPDAPAR